MIGDGGQDQEAEAGLQRHHGDCEEVQLQIILRAQGVIVLHANTNSLNISILPQSRDLVWCPVFKSVSTNWMHHLLYLAGRNEFEVEQIIEEHPRSA